MASIKRFLTLDIGASKVVLAEFLDAKSGPPELLNYGIADLGNDDVSSDSSAYIASAIREIMKEKGIKQAPLLMTISGQSVFPRYVKLPPVAPDKILQIIRYEAEQNVPFPIDEVVWDYQLIGGTDDGEMNVMLVAVKMDNVASLTECVQSIGLEPEVVDVAPMAIYNIIRYNYPEIEGCTMLLDIGARSSNLIFLESNRIFSRSIPVAGITVTTELMKQFDVEFDEAERLKRENAFVAFGGVYSGPDSEVADQVSKVVRNVITRLHAEVNRSINFYRSQQGGSRPSLVLLAGGSSIIPHTDTFFSEKLKVDVEYLNPFINIPVSANLDAERVGEDIHLLGEVAGVALRRALSCPVEINLLPPDLVARRQFRKRQPFFAVAMLGLMLVLLCWWGYFSRMKEMIGGQVQTISAEISSLSQTSARIKAIKEQQSLVKTELGGVFAVVDLRTAWTKVITTIHSYMPDGVWLRSMEPVVEDGVVTSVKISGRAFMDEVDASGIEKFRDDLKKSDIFSDETKITRMPVVSTEDYAREFEINIVLNVPIQLRNKKGK